MFGRDVFSIDASRAFADYWLQLRDKAPMPRKTSVQPADIRKLLPLISIVEVDPPASFVLRLVGTGISARQGKDMTNKDLGALPFSDTSTPFFESLRQAVGHPCGIRNIVQDTFATGRKVIVENVGLPLSDDAGKPKYVITLSSEFAPEHYTITSTNRIDSMIWMEHDYLDIGAGVPAALSVDFQPYQTHFDSETSE